jgi:hypothetical protein
VIVDSILAESQVFLDAVLVFSWTYGIVETLSPFSTGSSLAARGAAHHQFLSAIESPLPSIFTAPPVFSFQSLHVNHVWYSIIRVLGLWTSVDGHARGVTVRTVISLSCDTKNTPTILFNTSCTSSRRPFIYRNSEDTDPGVFTEPTSPQSSVPPCPMQKRKRILMSGVTDGHDRKRPFANRLHCQA